MGNYGRFASFLETKDKMKDGLAGIDYDGPLKTKPNQPPSDGCIDTVLPYKNTHDDDDKNIVWVAKDDGGKESLAASATPGMTHGNVIPDGKKPESKVKNPTFKKMTSEEFVAEMMQRHIPKDPNKGKVLVVKDTEEKEGLGHDGAPGMTPSNSITPAGKKPTTPFKYTKKPKRLTSEEFIDNTSDMTNAEFAKYMLEHSRPDTGFSTITDLHGNEFTPDPIQTINYLSGIILANPHIMDRFLHEIKRRDGLSVMIEEMMEHPETYDVLVDAMGDKESGAHRCGNIARSMNDKYMAVLDGVELDESVLDETVSGSPGERWGGDAEDGNSSNSGNGGAFGGGGGPSANTPNPERQGSAMSSKGDNNPFGGGGGPGTAQPSQPLGGSQAQFAGGNQPKPGGKGMTLGESAADNFFGAAKGYDTLKKRMTHHCTGPDCE